MFTSSDLRSMNRAIGCAFVLFVVLVIAIGFLLGRCTYGKTIRIQDAKETANDGN